MEVFTFMHDSVVTKNLRKATLQAYPNPNYLYNLHLKDIHTHPVRVISCIVLVVAELSDATIEYKLLWSSSVWKVYVRESPSHVSQAYNFSFYTTLGTQAANNAADYTLQAHDGDDII